jgi:hypothetical protein
MGGPGLSHVAGQGGEVFVDGNEFDVVGRVEPAIDLGDRGDALVRAVQRVTRRGIVHAARLHRNEGHDHLEVVGHAVVHFAQQCFEPGIAGAQVFLGAVPRAAQCGRFQHLVETLRQQVEEILAHRLDHIVLRAGLERGHGNAAFLRTGDVDDRGQSGSARRPSSVERPSRPGM